MAAVIPRQCEIHPASGKPKSMCQVAHPAQGIDLWIGWILACLKMEWHHLEQADRAG